MRRRRRRRNRILGFGPSKSVATPFLCTSRRVHFSSLGTTTVHGSGAFCANAMGSGRPDLRSFSGHLLPEYRVPRVDFWVLRGLTC